MSVWLPLAAVLMIGGLTPSLYLASRGDPAQRLVGLELTSAVSVLTLLALTEGFGQTGYLVVPLVLALLSFAGTLVFTRLIGPRS